MPLHLPQHIDVYFYCIWRIFNSVWVPWSLIFKPISAHRRKNAIYEKQDCSLNVLEKHQVTVREVSDITWDDLIPAEAEVGDQLANRASDTIAVLLALKSQVGWFRARFRWGLNAHTLCCSNKHRSLTQPPPPLTALHATAVGHWARIRDDPQGSLLLQNKSWPDWLLSVNQNGCLDSNSDRQHEGSWVLQHRILSLFNLHLQCACQMRQLVLSDTSACCSFVHVCLDLSYSSTYCRVSLWNTHTSCIYTDSVDQTVYTMVYLWHFVLPWRTPRARLSPSFKQ